MAMDETSKRALGNLYSLGYVGSLDADQAAFRAGVRRFKKVYAETYGWKVDEDVDEVLGVLFSPKCGNKDRISDNLTLPFSGVVDFPVTVFLKPPPTDDPEPQEGSPFVPVRSAINTWNKEGEIYGIELLNEVLQEDDAVCVFEWTSNGQDFGEDVIARADYPDSGQDPLRVLFDDAKSWVMGKGEGLDIEAAALHEFGHILGLRHSVDSGAVMHLSLNDERRFLESPDQVALRDLLADRGIRPQGLLDQISLGLRENVERIKRVPRLGRSFLRRLVS